MESNKKEQQGYPMRRERSFHVHPSRAGGRDPRRRSGMPAMRGKPAMELYRPPTMRSPGFVAACPAVNGFNGSPEAALAAAAAPTAAPAPLNINAKEFQPVSAAAGGGDGGGSPSKQPPPLLRSKSSKDARSLKSNKAIVPGSLVRSKSSKDGRIFKVTFRSGGAGDAPAPSDDATNHDKRTAEPAAAAVTVPPVPGGLKRSRSLGAELLPAPAGRPEPVAGAAAALGHFSPDVQALLAQAVQEPGRLTGRQTMDLVRHVFTRLVEAARYGEPAARLCLAIIERERTETFLETLLNTCQEWYQQRDRLLRPHQSTFGNGFVPASPRWIAFITFVNELYALLKRRQVATGSRPRAGSAVQILLELLAESCQVTLRAPSVNSLAETECVFLILTSIGRDLEQESPAQLERIMAAVRDALINCSLISAVSKTLLQLVELQAARWQLPANTVMYYYPMSAK
ncbi:CBP80/20-dependent translation initiation factor-like isoform X10 [Amphibalanus amphitrite]|uniref:CBP80/20-dependent translation initiation factor-like isoform X10 n=1 Tax=Amphibalanus amphitrite TaxID=1232801 RepID=UPI001C918044|nr:CBP80/20-dependent translation initiation factor-like isoform X10 [Amphibalanus amphitrite]